MSRILIVDDDATARETLVAMLEGEDYELELARNGPEALDLAGRILSDVILLDVMMPGMDGFEVCTRIRSMPGWPRGATLICWKPLTAIWASGFQNLILRITQRWATGLQRSHIMCCSMFFWVIGGSLGLLVIAAGQILPTGMIGEIVV